MTDQPLPKTLDSSATPAASVQAAPAPEAVLVATLRPNLARDLAGAMTLLFIFISTHIQHPTLLLRSQFGRSFRGESLQDAVAVALVLSAGLLLWQVWQAHRGQHRPWIIAFGLGLGAYCAYVVLMLLNSRFLFLELYGLEWEGLERLFREESYVPPVKALNMLGLAAGAAAVSTLYLGAAWHQRQQPGFLLRLSLMLLSLGLVFATLMSAHPLAELRGGLWQNAYDLRVALLLAAGFSFAGLFFVSQPVFAGRLRHLAVAFAGLLLLYLLLVGSAALGQALLLDFYGVQRADYSSLFSDPALQDALLAFDWGSILAGVAAASSVFLVMPWQRLAFYGQVLRENLAPLLIAVMAILSWEVAVNSFNIEEFLLPKPSVIWAEFKEIYPRLIAAGWLTFQNALFGFLVGCGAGILSGMVAARFSRFSRALLPLAIAANSVPIIAFAPITNLWFGVSSITAKIAIVAVLCYFPAMISTLRGLMAAKPIEIELMESYAATELEILRKVRIPVALPYILSALRLSTTLAMIGAIVAEFFGGSFSGLGYLIRNDAVLFRFPASWSAILVAALFGISFYIFISALERILMPWDQSFRREAR